ncbi:MAG: hypothetical protein ACLRQF_21585 [Thomasclavelia ramosa]
MKILGTCDYAVAIDAKSGLVLYNKNMDERMYPASIQGNDRYSCFRING